MNTLPKFRLCIHGGAGPADRNLIDKDNEQCSKNGMLESLKIGYKILKSGGTSLDAVASAVKSLEDNPIFNAGKGSTLNEDGYCELDSSIMEGKDLRVGCVTGVHTIKNPIICAKKILEVSEHNFFSGKGAEKFAKENNLELVERDYFITEKRQIQLQKAKDELKLKITKTLEEFKFGTVGAVCLDSEGNLAAGTSSGGRMNKKLGRVGDSPIIGAGTYANNETCGISCTGDGEVFIRIVAAYQVHSLMKYKDLSLKDAVEFTIDEILKKQFHSEGGMISISKDGEYQMKFNTSAMKRGTVDQDGNAFIYYFDENLDLTPIQYKIE